jgi:hypothetical protein
MTLTAVHEVADHRAGVASALVNMAQQIGAALGVAILTTISVVATDGVRAGATTSEALAHGYTTAFAAGAVLLALAAVLVIATVTTRRTRPAPGAGVL